MQALQKIQIENNSEVGAVVSSRVIAQELEKKHAHVIISSSVLEYKK